MTETKQTDLTIVSADRKAPKLEKDDGGRLNVAVDDADQLIRLYGTRTQEAAELILNSGINAFGEAAEDFLALVPAMAVEMEPRDAVEAMLITQMTATHVAMTKMSLKMHHSDWLQVREAHERSMTRLSRTFIAQMEALKKYRSKAQQTVRVERVEVKAGGQAVVGDVSYARGDHDGK